MQTYDEILNRMKNSYEEQTGFAPDKASDIGIRFAVLAGELFGAYNELDWLKRQMFPDTATGEYLERHAAERGLTRKNGTKASGTVRFSVNALVPEGIYVPQGTICASSGNNPVRFATKSTVYLSPTSNFVNAAVEALTEGREGNVPAGKISVIVTPVAGIDAVGNTQPMSGGTDKETDEQLRRRIIDSFVHISNGTNKAYYIQSALEVNGVIAAGVIPRNRGAGTVDVFIGSADNTPSQSLIDAVRNKLLQSREINVDIGVFALRKTPVDITFTIEVKEGYSFSDVSARCREAVLDYFSLLSAGETMYISDIGEYVKHVEGVKNYTMREPYVHDLSVSDDYIIVPDNIIIRERE